MGPFYKNGQWIRSTEGLNIAFFSILSTLAPPSGVTIAHIEKLITPSLRVQNFACVMVK